LRFLIGDSFYFAKPNLKDNMVLPMEVLIKQESADYDEEPNCTNYEVEVKLEIESSQVTEIDWCIRNKLNFVHSDFKRCDESVPYDRLLEYFPQRCRVCGDIFLDRYKIFSFTKNHEFWVETVLSRRPIVHSLYLRSGSRDISDISSRTNLRCEY
jgi:hypothetical protein